MADSMSPVGIYTETLARLYWQQGFVAKALDIYRHLVRTQPDNRQFRDQVVALERQLAGDCLGDGEGREGETPAGPAAVLRLSHLEHTERVIAHLEGWLHHVRRQRMTRKTANL